MTTHRIQVVGAGPVGLAFALFTRRLLGARVDIELTLPPGAPPAHVAARPLAIAQGTRQLLERVMRFPTDCADIERIDIALAGHPGRMQLSAAEMKLPRLGNVVRYGRLWQELIAQWQRAAGPPVSCGGAVVAVQPDLIVHAEGTGADPVARDTTAHYAVLADLRAQRPARGVAFERFRPDGPLALLPLPAGADRGSDPHYTLVWCGSQPQSVRRLALSRAEFDAELTRAFGERLGALSLAGERNIAPLPQREREQLHDGNEVWIGNAAQTLHPVAGQGFNLGIRDAFELARAIGAADLRSLQPDAALPDYVHARRLDRLTMQRVTGALASRLSSPLARPLQSLVLGMADSSAPLRHWLARGFMLGWPRA